jgi:hypothetical protein
MWSVPPGRAARPEDCVLSRARSKTYERSLRPCLGTIIAPRRRATFRQTLLGLATDRDDHRRVLAVLAYLRG